MQDRPLAAREVKPDGYRGRPSRLGPPGGNGAGRAGFDERVGWLLRINRLLGADESLGKATRFAEALRSGEGPASPAQISRWETGASRVDYRTVRRYEQVLGLPAHGLVAMADLAGTRGGPGLDRRFDPDDPAFHRRSGQLLERALTGGPMDGAA